MATVLSLPLPYIYDLTICDVTRDLPNFVFIRHPAGGHRR